MYPLMKADHHSAPHGEMWMWHGQGEEVNLQVPWFPSWLCCAAITQKVLTGCKSYIKLTLEMLKGKT